MKYTATSRAGELIQEYRPHIYAPVKIVRTLQGEPKGFFKLAEGLVASSLEKNLEEDQNHLKAILEGV